MRTQHNNHFIDSPFVRSTNPSSEESAFLGLFEGKWKARREAKQSDSGSSSNSSGGLDASGGGFFNVLGSILGGGLGLAGVAAPILPALGIGSKARMNEIQAQNTADANLYNLQKSIQNDKAADQKQMIAIGGALLLVIVVVLVALKS